MIEYLSNYWEQDSLELIVRLSTISSLIGTPVFYFLKKWHDESARRKRTSKNLYSELEDALHTLTGKKGFQKKKMLYYDQRIYAVFLNHDQ